MAGVSLADAALSLAARGFAVFPAHNPDDDGRCSCGAGDCASPGKHPRGDLVPTGRNAASRDPDLVRRWWEAVPAANIGVATGGSGGLLVVDLDGDEAADWYGAALLEHGPPGGGALPDGATVRTARGWHLWLRPPAGVSVRSSAGRVGPKVDVRGDGGYVIAPPSRHPAGRRYVWRDPLPEGPLPELTSAWVDLLGRRRERPVPPPAAPAPPATAATPYGREAARRELERLREAPKGTRNHALNQAAFALGQLVAGGELPYEATRAFLVDAGLAIGLTRREVEGAHGAKGTVDSGLAAGMLEPRNAPTRERRAA